jgi:hypothetical protein
MKKVSFIFLIVAFMALAGCQTVAKFLNDSGVGSGSDVGAGMAGASSSQISGIAQSYNVNSGAGLSAAQSSQETQPLSGLKEIFVTVKNKSGDHVFSAEVAENEAQREKGLMFRTALAADHGMLFTFEKAGQLSFWMKNTLIPLDMLFIGPDHKIVRALKWVMPCQADPCPLFGSIQSAQYVLELNGGMVEKLGITEGDQVNW